MKAAAVVASIVFAGFAHAQGLQIVPYPASSSNTNRMAIVILDGAAQVRWLNLAGFSVFAVPADTSATRLFEAVSGIRVQSSRWGVDANRIGVMDLSRGSVLAGEAERSPAAGRVNVDPMLPTDGSRPDFVIVLGRNEVPSPAIPPQPKNGLRRLYPQPALPRATDVFTFLADASDGWHARFLNWVRSMDITRCSPFGTEGLCH